MTTTSGIKLDEQTRARLQALARSRERTPHWLMKRAILEYLEREEIAERENRICEERWQEYLKTGEYVSHEEVEKWLDKEIAILSAQIDKQA